MTNTSSRVVLPTNTPDICFISFVDFDPHNMSLSTVRATWTFLIAINGFVAPSTIVVNALVIWAVVGDENLRSSAFNLLLASLALSDFLVGLLVDPLHCLLLVCFMSKNICTSNDCTFTAYILSLMACLSLTMLSFTIASVERYLAIEKPNYYRTNITGKQVMIKTVTIWLICLGYLLISTIFLYRNHNYLLKVQGTIGMSILCTITLYCSSKVQLTAYRQRRVIAVQYASVQQPNDQQEQRLKEYKRVFTMTMLMVLSILFYTPFIKVSVIHSVMGKHLRNDFLLFAMPICSAFVNLQSLINPIIMSLRLSYIRKGIRNKLVCRVQGTD